MYTLTTTHVLTQCQWCLNSILNIKADLCSMYVTLWKLLGLARWMFTIHLQEIYHHRNLSSIQPISWHVTEFQVPNPDVAEILRHPGSNNIAEVILKADCSRHGESSQSSTKCPAALRLVHFLRWLAILQHDSSNKGPYTEEKDECCHAGQNDRVLPGQEVPVQHMVHIYEGLEPRMPRLECHGRLCTTVEV